MLRLECILPSSYDFYYQRVPVTNDYDSYDDCVYDDIDHQKLKAIPNYASAHFKNTHNHQYLWFY